MQNTFYIRFNQSTKFVDGFFPKYENGTEINYTDNAEFQQMLVNKNYIEGTEENRNWCFAQARTPKVINGILQPDTQTQAEIDAGKLVEVKKTAKSTLESARKKAQYENVTYKGKTYFATPVAQDNLFKAYFLAKELNITSLNWLDVNNMQITLILPDALALLKLLYDKIQPLYMNEAIAQNTIINATTVAQVEEVLSGGSYTVTPPTNGNSGGLGGNVPPSSSV